MDTSKHHLLYYIPESWKGKHTAVCGEQRRENLSPRDLCEGVHMAAQKQTDLSGLVKAQPLSYPTLSLVEDDPERPRKGSRPPDPSQGPSPAASNVMSLAIFNQRISVSNEGKPSEEEGHTAYLKVAKRVDIKSSHHKERIM